MAKNYLKRYLWFVIGIAINSLGIALITKAALGPSPISSVSYVLSLYFPLTLGQFTFLVNLIFILAQVVILKKDFALIQFLQIAVNIVFSVCIDASMTLLNWVSPNQLGSELLCLVIGCIVLGLGICIEVAPDVLVVPGEGIVRAIAKVSKKKFGSVKIAFDITLVLTALILSLIFFHHINGLGLGTIVSALTVGKIVNIFNQKLPIIPYISKLRQGETL